MTDRVFLQCRDMGHAWDWLTDIVTVVTPHGTPSQFQRELRCDRCGTHRRDRFAIQNGHVARLGNGYKYPANYQVPGGLSREAIRDEVFASVLGTAPPGSKKRRFRLTG